MLDVHPVAALFPMLPDDELADMAADIAGRGLLQAIVRDNDGLILDGRNRLAACEIAGVEPRFETYDGDDPAGYALAANIVRRNLTKGQVAMIAAQACSVSEQTMRSMSERTGVSATRIAVASVVLKHSSTLADAVVAGTALLDTAYQQALDAKKAAEGDEAKLAALRAEYPDLADKVVEGDLTLAGARAEAKARTEVARQHAVRVSDTFRSIIGRVLTTYPSPELRAEVVALYSDDLGDARPEMITAKTIRQASEYLGQIADAFEDSR